MANTTLFAAHRPTAPEADAVNHAGGAAYALTADHALAVFAHTGTFNSTFYVSAKDQLDNVRKLANEVRPDRLAKVAVLARTKGYMKDMPAYLLAVLYQRDPGLWKRVFPRVVDNGKMLRTYAQIARSGAAGRVINLSSRSHRRAINEWLDRRSGETVFRNSVGNTPSLVGVFRQAHVKPATREKEALLKYLFNNEFGWTHRQEDRETGLGSTPEDLPSLVRQYEAFKRDKSLPVPQADFRQLDSLGLTTAHWTQIFRSANWTFTRMNLNTAARHGVLKDQEMVELIARRLRDRDEIRNARAFPYQLFTAFQETRNKVPHEISEALQDAVEVSLENVPSLGDVVVAVDVSGSMGHAVTGNRGSATTSVRNIDVAALVASALLRRNRSARVIPFANANKPLTLNPRDSVMTNAASLSALLGGGTNCSAPLAQLNAEGHRANAFVLLSDNESWVDGTNNWNPGNGTRLHEEWLRFKRHNPNARMVCVDFSPNNTGQVKERPDILQVAGWSDVVFELMAAFVFGGNDPNFWVKETDKIEI